MKSLNIRVAFSAIDKLTCLVNAARQSAGGLSESSKTQSSIKDLDSQSCTFNRLRDSVQKTSRKIDDASRTLEGLESDAAGRYTAYRQAKGTYGSAGRKAGAP